jgi:lysophospholipase L1-like esterase
MNLKSILITAGIALAVWAAPQAVQNTPQTSSLNLAEYLAATGNGANTTLTLTAAPQRFSLQPNWTAVSVRNTGNQMLYVSRVPEANPATVLAVIAPGVTTNLFTGGEPIWLWSPLGATATIQAYIKRTISRAGVTPISADGLRPCADYIDYVAGASGNNHKDYRGWSRMQFTTSGSITRLKLVYPGWYPKAATPFGDMFFPSTENVQAYIEYPAGTYYRVHFGGANIGKVDPGGTLVSNVLHVSIPAQTAFYVRTFKETPPLYSGTLPVSVSAGNPIPLPSSIPNDPALVGSDIWITGGTGGSNGNGLNYGNFGSLQELNSANTATGGSTTTLVDSKLIGLPANLWVGASLTYQHGGTLQTQTVTAFLPSTGTLTVGSAYTTGPVSGDPYFVGAPASQVIFTQGGSQQTFLNTDNTSTFSIYASGTTNLVHLDGQVRAAGDQSCPNYQMFVSSSYLNAAPSSGKYNTWDGKSNNGYAFGPICVLGDTSVPAVGMVGDSIPSATWSSASQDSHGDGGYGAGFMDLALFKSYGVLNFGLIKLCESGSGFKNFNDGLTSRRLAVLGLCDYVIVSIGTNDISNGVSLSNLEAYASAYFNALASMGVQVYACTITPRSSDSEGTGAYGYWISAATQTPWNNDAIRTAFNNWLRTVPAPLSGVYDVASAVEVNSSNVLTQNGGLWLVGANVFNAKAPSTTGSGTSSNATLVDTVNLPTDTNYHYDGNVLAVTRSGVTYYGIITAYAAASQTITCAAGLATLAGTAIPSATTTTDSYSILGNTATALSGGAGVHPNDYGASLMAAAINTGLLLPVAKIDAGWYSFRVPLARTTLAQALVWNPIRRRQAAKRARRAKATKTFTVL